MTTFETQMPLWWISNTDNSDCVGSDLKQLFTLGYLKGMCGLWYPTARKKGLADIFIFSNNRMASSVLCLSGKVPSGTSATSTGQSRLAWSFPSCPLHVFKNKMHNIGLLNSINRFWQSHTEQNSTITSPKLLNHLERTWTLEAKPNQKCLSFLQTGEKNTYHSVYSCEFCLQAITN